MTKILITGAGVNSPLGCSLEEFLRNMTAAPYGIDHIRNFDARFFPVDFGAEVRENGEIVKTGQEVDRKEFFIKRAVKDLITASPDFENYPAAKRMIHMGAGVDFFDLAGYIDSEDSRAGLLYNYCRNSDRAVDDLVEIYNIRGGKSVNVSACVASTQAMGLSFRVLKQAPGLAIITGGFDSMLNPLSFMAFYKLGAFSNYPGEAKHACRPFDKNRSGLVLGEGGIAFLMQREEDVKQNRPLMEVCGYSSTMDAYNATDPHPEGIFLAQSVMEAIREAGITPEDIDCVHLHGTGTPKNEIAETKALALVFPDRYKEIPVFSLKSQIGHLIGACGAMEMLGVLYSFQNQAVPPTLNFQDPDPDIPLHVIKDEPLYMKIDYILKLNSGLGGQNTAFVMKKYK